MRVTDKITSDNSLYYIQQARAKLDKVNEQVSSGQIINRPGEDPIGTRQLLDLDAKIKEGRQYQSNITKANIWQSITNTALGGMSSMIKQVKQLAASISSGSSDPSIISNTVDQLKALKTQLVDMGNTQVGDQYAFGGYETRQPPFNTTDNSFAGTSDGLNVEINKGSTLQLNVNGDQVLLGVDKATGNPGKFGSVNILDTIDNLIAGVTANDTTAISAASTEIGKAATQVNNAISLVASNTVRLDSMNTMLTNNENALQTIVSNIQTVDYAKAATELNQQQTALQAALAATAKVSAISILDYLK